MNIIVDEVRIEGRVYHNVKVEITGGEPVLHEKLDGDYREYELAYYTRSVMELIPDYDQ